MEKIIMTHKSKLTRLSLLKNNPKNAAKHPADQISALVKLFRKYGFIGSVLVTTDNVIIAGHGRVEAARILGMHEIPTVVLDHLTRDEADAFMIAENKSAEMKIWDESLLQEEIERLCELDFDLDDLALSTVDDLLNAVPGEHEERKDGEPSPDDDFETDARRDRGLWDDDEEVCEACGQKLIAA